MPAMESKTRTKGRTRNTATPFRRHLYQFKNEEAEIMPCNLLSVTEDGWTQDSAKSHQRLSTVQRVRRLGGLTGRRVYCSRTISGEANDNGRSCCSEQAWQ
jgi:hypothetical protein